MNLEENLRKLLVCQPGKTMNTVLIHQLTKFLLQLEPVTLGNLIFGSPEISLIYNIAKIRTIKGFIKP